MRFSLERGRVCGGRSFLENLGRWRGFGLLEGWEILLGWAFGKTLGKGGKSSNIWIGNGRHTIFWWDSWVREFKLKDVYLTLFRIVSHKKAIVAHSREREGRIGDCWEVQFRRPFQYWELNEVTRFLEHIFLLKAWMKMLEYISDISSKFQISAAFDRYVGQIFWWRNISTKSAIFLLTYRW